VRYRVFTKRRVLGLAYRFERLKRTYVGGRGKMEERSAGKRTSSELGHRLREGPRGGNTA